MPSLGSGEATAVARTTVSPVLTRAAPEACLAMRPVSKTSRLPPASSTATSCLVDIESSFHFFAWETWDGSRGRVRQMGRAFARGARYAHRPLPGAHERQLPTGHAKARAEPTASRRPWPGFEF